MRQKLILTIGIVIFLASICFAAWDAGKPADSDAWNNAAGFIRDNWDALEVILGVDLDSSTINLEVADLKTTSPWLDVRTIITSGTGTSGDPWIISSPSAFENVFFFVAGFYQLSANWNIISDSHIWATKGIFLDPAGFTLECSGTVSATTTDLTADGGKGALSVTVADESSFSADDWIEISASKDVYPDWNTSGRTLPRELNRVVTTAANTLNLKYPLKREYDFDGGFSDNPTVIKITTVKENVVIENINIQGDIDFGYVNNLAIRGITTEQFSFTEVVKSFELTNMEANLPKGTADDFAIGLDAGVDGLISVRTLGARDGVRIFGCANVSGSISVLQCDQRAVHMFGSDDIYLSPVVVLGDRTRSDNAESVLFDYCGYCSVRDAFIKEENKTGDWSAVEFRGSPELVEFTDSVVYGYSSLPIVVSSESRCQIVDRNKIFLVSAVTSVIGLEGSTSPFSDAVIKIRGNEIVNAGDTGHLLRTQPAFSVSGNDTKYIELSGNKVPLATSQFLCLLVGSPGTQGAETVEIRDNVIDILNTGSGGFVSTDGDFVITNLIFHGNTEIGNTGAAPVYAGVTNIMFGDDNFQAVSTTGAGLYRVVAPKQIGDLADAATPSISGADVWATSGTTGITNFLNGVTGQVITIIAEDVVVITDGTNIFTPTGGNLTINPTDVLVLIQKADGKWYTVSFSDNT